MRDQWFNSFVGKSVV